MTDLPPINNIARRSLLGGTPGLRDRKAVKSDFQETLDKAASSTPLKEAAQGKRPSPPGEIRHDLVNKFRNDLKSGAYEVKSDEIADKIIQKIREEKDRVIL
jgi:anti-sigma28 factor (negative regulator of flagellin synthesis)